MVPSSDDFSQQVRVDHACDAFEALWARGTPTSLESVLEQASSEDQNALLRELLQIELAYRRRTGETPNESDYIARFPSCRDEVRAAFHRTFSEAETDDHLELRLKGRDSKRPITSDRSRAEARQETVSINHSPAESTITDLVLPERLGSFHIRERLGQGGMGTVYRAEQLEPVRREVAIKLIRTGTETAAILARFDAERQTLAILEHPHIARVLEAGSTPSGTPFFVMELVKGSPLTTYCDQNQLSLNTRLQLFLQVCEAVHHAHQKGVIHRDLKPSNILVTEIDGRPVAKVIDFGLAKAVGSAAADVSLATQTGQVIGTLEYMSPEQASGKANDVDTRADVYSLGVILHELLCGATPIKRLRDADWSLEQVLRAIREAEPLSMAAGWDMSSPELAQVATLRALPGRRLVAMLRSDLDWIVRKSLEKDRSRRYATVKDFADDIHRYLSNRPVSAGPPGVGYRIRKFTRRYFAAVAAAVVLLLAILGGGIGTSIGLVRALAAEQNLQRKVVEVTHQRNRARTAERNRKIEADTLREMNQFFSNEILLGNSLESANPNLKFRDVLSAAAAKIDGHFGKRPLVEATVRMSIGDAYRAISDYESARHHFARALEICRSSGKNNEAMLIEAETKLASALSSLSLYADAKVLIDDAIMRSRKLHGEDSTGSLAVLAIQVQVLLETGHSIEAEAICRQVLAIAIKKLGKNNEQVLTIRHNLAMAIKKNGNLAEAEEMLRQVLHDSEQDPNLPQSEVIKTKTYLAVLLLEQGKFEPAEKLLLEAIAIQPNLLDPDHQEALRARAILSQAYVQHGNVREAVDMMEQLLPLYEMKYGEQQRDTCTLKSMLGFLYGRLQQPEKCEKYLKETLSVAQANFGEQDELTQNIMGNLALYYQENNRAADALPLQQAIIATTTNSLSSTHPKVLTARYNLALTLMTLEKYDEALVELQNLLALPLDVLGEQQPIRLFAPRSVAEIYQAQGKLAEAETQLKVVLAEHKRLLPAGHTEIIWTNHLLGENLFRQRKFREAKSVLEETITLINATAKNHWLASYDGVLLGISLTEEDFANGESVAIANYDRLVQKNMPAQDQDKIEKAIRSIAQMYEDAGRPEDAAKWLQKLPSADNPEP